MSTIESGDPLSGSGRVTRSLRKRLTSVDSDLSSRPGTPVLHNLQTVAEIVTPSKRITRRTSLSTPAVTPSKAKSRLENIETLNSPARRGTRRRSVSIREQEEHTIQIKSKEPSIDAVKEEETTPEVKNKRITRSFSKSPQELLPLTNSSSKKLLKKSGEQEEEVINLDDSSRVESPNLSKKNDPNINEMVVHRSSPSEPKSAQKKNSSMQKKTPSKASIEQRNPNNENRLTIEQSKYSPAKIQTKQDSTSFVESSPAKKHAELDISQKDVISPVNAVIGSSSPPKRMSIKTKSPKNVAVKQLEHDSPQKKIRPEKLKNVVFNETADEDTFKIVFPKTPGLTKSKSCILDSSEYVEKSSLNMSADKSSEKEELGEEYQDVIDTKTPYKLKVNAVESSTPIHRTSLNSNKSSEVDVWNKESAQKNTDNNAAILFPKSWSHSVSGTVKDTAKIDSIESEQIVRRKLEEEKALKKSHSLNSQDQSKEKEEKVSNSVVTDDSDYDDMIEEDDDYNENAEEEEEQNIKKTIFVDDEAMEVAEGEESMDSEQRAYLEENEIPVYGESIGSEDSEEDDYEDEDEADDEDRAFVVSDTEDIMHSAGQSDSDDSTHKKSKDRKKYKRVVQMSESSNEESLVDAVDRNFCLILESSVDEDHCEKKNLNQGKLKHNDNKEKSKENTDEVVKVGTPNRRGSLKNIEYDDKVENTGNACEISNLDTPNKRKSLKQAKREEAESASKSLTNVDDNPKHKKRSEIIVQEEFSDLELKEDKIIKKCLSALERSIDESAETMNKSKTSLTDGEPASSIKKLDESLKSTHNILESEEHYDNRNTSVTESLMNNTGQDDEDEENTVRSSKKSLRISLKRTSTGRKCHESAESPIKDLKQPKNSSRKSLKKESSEADKSTPLKQIRTSFNQSKEGGNEKGSNVSKKFNLGRNSMDEPNEEEKEHILQDRSLNKSKLGKSCLSLEDVSEPEETLSASEVPSETSGGKSLNSSKRGKKSLNRSKLSLENDNQISLTKQGSFQCDADDLESVNKRRSSLIENMNLKADYGSEDSSSDNDKREVSSDEEMEAQFSPSEVKGHQTKAEEKSIMLEFLGEEEFTNQPSPKADKNLSRRKSVNESKLDETFELQSKSNSVPICENLHCSVIRKSLNQNQPRNEAIKQIRNETESEADEVSDTDNSTDSLIQKQLKKVLPERVLSVSLSNTEKVKSAEKAIRNSFTIGVSVRKTSSSDKAVLAHLSNSDESGSEAALSEQDDLKNVKHSHHVGPYKSRNSLSTSLKAMPPNADYVKKQKRIKHTSLYMQEEGASQSFAENIAEEKKKLESRKKKLLNSTSGGIENVAVNEIVQNEPRSERKQKHASKSEDQSDIKHILSRCDEILEAANRAKLDAKLNAKKSKGKKPKWMDKEEIPRKEKDEVKIPLVSNKELKRKEKIKKELAKAIKHSTAMLKTIDPKLVKKLKATKVIEPDQTQLKPSSSKRLPTEFLEALPEVPQPKKKKSKEIETTPPSDKENSKKNCKKDTHVISDISSEKKKKKPSREILETAIGTVIVEPSTPAKLKYQNGFRESPKTPVGFKVQDIYSAGQNGRNKSGKHGKQLFTPSEEFIENEFSLSSGKLNPKKEKAYKRKRYIEEPVYSLPKTQWTASGVFVEEDLFTAHPLANSTTTQFMVTSLNGKKKNKNPSKVMSSTTLSRAMKFKQKAAFNDEILRETTRDLIYRKQRKLVNNQY